MTDLELKIVFLNLLKRIKICFIHLELKNVSYTRYLTGNPCTQYNGYRLWVIANLRNLKELDGIEILRSEILRSRVRLEGLNVSIKEDEAISFGESLL